MTCPLPEPEDDKPEVDRLGGFDFELEISTLTSNRRPFTSTVV